MVYGAFTSDVDMKSGAPAFGTPENARATIACGQLARFYKLPYRASNSSASNAVDAQAAYESQMSIWSSVLAHANLVYHGAGWMEGGLTASFEKIVLDVEMLQMMAETIAAVRRRAARDRARRHRLGADRRPLLRRRAHAGALRDGVLRPLVSNWRNYETWQDAGAHREPARHLVWQQALERYEQPPLDPGDRRAPARVRRPPKGRAARRGPLDQMTLPRTP